MKTPHLLGGRRFSVIGESTVEHDLTFMGLLRKAGLDMPTLREGELPKDFATRLLGDLLGSGKACELLGCLLIPEGVESEDWTPELGQETAEHIGHLTSAADKQKVNQLILSALVDFFESGLASLAATRASSYAEGAKAGPSPEQAAMAAGER